MPKQPAPAKSRRRSSLIDTRVIYCGDNLEQLPKLPDACIDLIYIDPPFDVGADFTLEVPLGDGREAVEKTQSVLEFVAYNDTWNKNTDSYLLDFRRFFA